MRKSNCTGIPSGEFQLIGFFKTPHTINTSLTSPDLQCGIATPSPIAVDASEGYIVLRNYFGENPVIDGSGKKGDGLIIMMDNSYIKIIGFELRNLTKGDTPAGLRIEGASHHIEVRNNRIHDIKDTQNAHGLAIYGNKKDPIHNITIDGNEIYDCKLGQSESLVLNGNVKDFVVSNNKVHDNDNIGVDLIGYEGTCPDSSLDRARDGIVSGNMVYNIDTKPNPTYSDQCAGGIYVDG